MKADNLLEQDQIDENRLRCGDRVDGERVRYQEDDIRTNCPNNPQPGDDTTTAQEVPKAVTPQEVQIPAQNKDKGETKQPPEPSIPSTDPDARGKKIIEI